MNYEATVLNRDVLEDVERDRQRARFYAERLKRLCHVLSAVWMMAINAVLDLEHLDAAGGIQEVVLTYVIGDDRQHPFAGVGSEVVSSRELDL
nr:hypothetical protein [Pseudoroseomonas wenyumeiae]